MTQYSGGCACGQVRYHASADPYTTNQCQCLDCQKTSGTGHSSLLVFPKEAVAITGDISGYTKIADSGQPKTSHFCPNCGSPIAITVEVAPHIVAIHAASLDEPSIFAPATINYHIRAHDWDVVDPEVPRFERLPPN